jgi:peptidoglycan/LPS O-acetylase OafA/YrhL
MHEYFWLNMILLALTIAGFFFITTPTAKIITGAITGALIVINHYKPLKSNWLSSLGDYSYAIYLIHIPVCIYLLGDIKETKLLENNLWLSILWDMALVALTIVLSKLVYTYVEVPFIQKGKNMADKYQKAFA